MAQPNSDKRFESNPQSADGDAVPGLDRLREAIDELDRRILTCLNERARLVQKVGELKQSVDIGPVYVAARERDLILALRKRNPGPFPDAAIGPVYREIISGTRSLEERVRVAFLGPEGTFSHQAALTQFGSQVDFCPVPQLADVFTATERGEAHFGVVPMENTIDGAINPTFDGLMESEVTICAELLLRVSQNLLSKSGSLDAVSTVASIPQALSQCRNWLRVNLPSVEIRETSSTGTAAKLAAEDDSVAAIGSSAAAEAYGLLLTARDVEDRRENTTRFIVIGQEAPRASGVDLTSAAFTVGRDQPGALYTLLEPFARHGVNLTSVQSRPIKGRPWEYVFFVDLEGHETDEAVRLALDDAAHHAHSTKILGSFPRAVKTRPSAAGERAAS